MSHFFSISKRRAFFVLLLSIYKHVHKQTHKNKHIKYKSSKYIHCFGKLFNEGEKIRKNKGSNIFNEFYMI